MLPSPYPNKKACGIFPARSSQTAREQSCCQETSQVSKAAGSQWDSLCAAPSLPQRAELKERPGLFTRASALISAREPAGRGHNMLKKREMRREIVKKNDSSSNLVPLLIFRCN